MPKAISLRIDHHPKAPLFRNEGNPVLLLDQAIMEISSGNLSTANESIRQVLRQAGYINLWFFLRCILSLGGGPYESLTNHLHVEMCNFYQASEYDDGPNSTLFWAGFIGRKHFKTSCWTHGGLTWSITINPNRSIGLGSGVMDRALEFMWQIQTNIAKNEVYKWLYPEYVPLLNQKRWNDKEMVMPKTCMDVQLPEASIKPFAVLGSTQSLHFNRLHLDDIVGDAQLNADRQAGADMIKTSNWLKTNIRTLGKNMLSTRVFNAGTRYSSEDPHEYIMSNMKALQGYTEILNEVEHYALTDDGEWTVYYRLADEGGGESIFPERIPLKVLNKIATDDWWTYIMQYQNKAWNTGLSEFADFTIQECWLEWSEKSSYFILHYEIGPKWAKREVAWPLDVCDVTMPVDPAASEKKRSAQTSRTAILVLAVTPDGARCLIDGKVDFMSTTAMFDEMFRLKKKYYTIRATLLELQGPFKALESVLVKEQNTRHEWLNLRPVTAVVDKDVRIRSNLHPVFMNNLVYATSSIYPKIKEEIIVFPDGKKKDALDAFAIGERGMILPSSEEEEGEHNEAEEEMLYLSDRSPVTGY